MYNEFCTTTLEASTLVALTFSSGTSFPSSGEFCHLLAVYHLFEILSLQVSVNNPL